MPDRCPTLRVVLPYRAIGDRSVRLTVDKGLFPRAAVKRAASVLVDRCGVLLDLDEDGAVVATLTLPEDRGERALAHLAGDLGNLLVADLVERKLTPEARAARNLLAARALDGALPAGPRDRGRR